MSLRKGKWVHSNPVCSLGMEVLSAVHRGKKYIKMKVRLFHLKNGRLQYLGKGIDGYTEYVKLPIEREADWSRFVPE